MAFWDVMWSLACGVGDDELGYECGLVFSV